MLGYSKSTDEDDLKKYIIENNKKILEENKELILTQKELEQKIDNLEDNEEKNENSLRYIRNFLKTLVEINKLYKNSYEINKKHNIELQSCIRKNKNKILMYIDYFMYFIVSSYIAVIFSNLFTFIFLGKMVIAICTFIFIRYNYVNNLYCFVTENDKLLNLKNDYDKIHNDIRQIEDKVDFLQEWVDLT